MLFNSYVFVLLFLPLCLMGYFFLNHLKAKKTAHVFLLIMSLWFYAYFNFSYLFIILSSIGINYFCYILMEKILSPFARKGIAISGIAINVGILFYFKYFDFFLENINYAMKTNFSLQNILLPLGISFFTFQQISFLVDAYKKEVPEYDFLSYACYVTFFPQLIAGPIVTHDELIPQLMDSSKKHIQWDNIACGLYLFSLGLGKKVLLADSLGNAVNYGFAAIGYLNSTDAFVIMLSYTLQIYFDFSGYCDMAMGIARMFNINLPLNFNSPYKAKNIAEFWDRWHMTLTRFLTRYIYIPLGGNRKGVLRTYVNIFLVFLISGFWHGANWTFVIWGLLHGILMILTRALKKYIDKIPAFLSWIFTFAFLNVTWLIFRADSLSDAAYIIKAAFAGNFGRVSLGLAQSVHTIETNLVGKVLSFATGINVTTNVAEWVILLLLIIGLFILTLKKNAYERAQCFKPTWKTLLVTVILFVWCVVSFAGVSTFLYFNF